VQAVVAVVNTAMSLVVAWAGLASSGCAVGSDDRSPPRPYPVGRRELATDTLRVEV